MGEAAALRLQVSRQVAHWARATVALDDPSNFASDAAWRSLESYLDLALRRELQAAVDRLKRDIAVMRVQLAAARTVDDFERVWRAVVSFRRRFAQVETVLEFYGEAVNSRTSPKLTAILRACDLLAAASLQQILPVLGREVPPVLTYVDKGLGAAILRQGLRLWDPNSISPAAAIKITRHNLGLPTSAFHEAGHQMAFMVGWNEELAAGLNRELSRYFTAVARTWTGWTTEVAADAFAFVIAGYGAVAVLHDVLAGEAETVFRVPFGDPHPVAYLRVLLGVEMCRRCYGAGPWDDMAAAWRRTYPVEQSPATDRELLIQSVPLLPRIADLCLTTPMRAFHGRPLVAYVDPQRVSPAALARVATQAGPALYTSPHWLRTASLELLALSAYRLATQPEQATAIAQQTEQWMLRLGGSMPMAA